MDKTLAFYSNWGSSLDLVAPGGDVNVDQNDDGQKDGILQNTFNPTSKVVSDFSYYFFQGTSMASPHVASVAALVIAAGIATNPAGVQTVLQTTALDLGSEGRDDLYGYGLVDAPVEQPDNIAPTAEPQPVTTIVNTPDAEFSGEDSFTFRVFDGELYSNPATITATLDSGPLAGATVTGHWIDATTDLDTGITDTAGTVNLASDQVKASTSSLTFTFVVDQITKDGVTYALPEGGASGSIIYTPPAK